MRPQQRTQMVVVQAAPLIDFHHTDFDSTHFGQVFQGVQNGVVLQWRGDGMGDAVCFDTTTNCRIVGLGTARREEDFGGCRVQKQCHCFTGFLDGRTYHATVTVNRRWVTKILLHQREHGFQNSRIEPGGGGIIKINSWHRLREIVGQKYNTPTQKPQGPPVEFSLTPTYNSPIFSRMC